MDEKWTNNKKTQNRPIKKCLFENYSPLTSIYLRRKLEEVLVNYEPRISLTSIIINDDSEDLLNPQILDDVDKNQLRVDIHFYVVGVPGPQTVNIQLQRLR